MWFWNSLSNNPFSAMSVLIAGAALIIFQWWRQRKGLRYWVVSKESIAGISEHYNDSVKVLFEGRAVKQVHLVLIEIANCGWKAIEPSDFVEPVTINFGNDAEVMTHQAIETIPTELKVELAAERNVVTVNRLLLNRGDTVRVKALVDNFQGQVAVNSRIKDIPDIKNSDGNLLSTDKKFNLLMAGFLLSILGVLIYAQFFLPFGEVSIVIRAKIINADNSKPIVNVLVMAEDSKGYICGSRSNASGEAMCIISTIDWENSAPIRIHTESPEYQAKESLVSLKTISWESFVRPVRDAEDAELRLQKK